MKFTLSWLKEHLTTDEPLDRLADKLTMVGLEVESIEDKAKALAPFVIAQVLDAQQHPNADRLRVCFVSTGTGDPIQVVCGAPNARTGMTGVFSPPGTYIPGKKITLDATAKDIRGVKSSGMLVSEAEIELSDNHEGIIDLPPGAPVGESYAKWAGLDDPVIEINLTPNRPDCTGVHGIARDLAAADMGELIDPVSKLANRPPADTPARSASQDDEGWLGRLWRMIRGVRHDVPVSRREAASALPCPVAVTIEIARAVSRFRASPRARREERPLARMAAEAADRDRAASHQCTGRHHQLHDLRPRAAAARVRRREGARKSHRPARPQGRKPARARWTYLPARRQHLRHRR